MGIPRFYADWIRDQTKAIKSRCEGNINSLSIDLNGIIHNKAQEVFHYGRYDNPEARQYDMSKNITLLYNEVYISVANEIVRLVSKYKPNVLVVAVDGVVPLAKINQQRNRRYITGIESRNSQFMRFDSASISPGTEFMIGLDSYLRDYFKTHRNQLTYKLVYSSHLIPGEGEHKILDLMRENPDNLYGEGIHLFHGADADLYMLSLLSPLNNIWIVREDINRTSYINIEVLKQDVRNRMKTPTAIEDFVILAFFLGNDFVPHIFSINNINILDNIIANYRKHGKSLTSNGRINFDVLKVLVSTLAFNEASDITRMVKSSIKYPHPALESSKIIQDSNISVDYRLFKKNWYDYALYPKNSSIYLDYVPDEMEIKTIIQDACNSYYMTLEWVYLYYSKGSSYINLDWYYPYEFTPLLTDMLEPVIGTQHLVESDPIHQFYHPLQQLLMILYPNSSNIVPFGLGSLMSASSSLADLYPIDAEITRDGYNTDWQKDIKLPSLDPQRIVDLVVPESIPGVAEKYPYNVALYIDIQESLKRDIKPTNTRRNTPTVGKKIEIIRPMSKRR